MLRIYGLFEMHGRLLSAKVLAEMQYSQLFSSNLDFNSDPNQVVRFLVYLTKLTFWDSKSEFSYSD